jgi:hypothetical protein
MQSKNQIRGNIDCFEVELGSGLTLTTREREELGTWARDIAAVEALGEPVTVNFIGQNLDHLGDFVVQFDRKAITIRVSIELNRKELEDLLDIVRNIGLRLGFTGVSVGLEYIVFSESNDGGLRTLIKKHLTGELNDRRAA